MESGYGPQSASVQNKVEFKLRPLRKRTVQIVDAEGVPQNGLRVEHAVEEHLAGSPSAMRWWTEDFCLTDELVWPRWKRPLQVVCRWR